MKPIFLYQNNKTNSVMKKLKVLIVKISCFRNGVLENSFVITEFFSTTKTMISYNTMSFSLLLEKKFVIIGSHTTKFCTSLKSRLVK